MTSNSYEETTKRMKRKFEWQHEEEEGDEDHKGPKLSNYEDHGDSSSEDENDEEPRIKLILQDLSGAVSKRDASDLLHSMAVSKNILFWTFGGELLRNQRRIPGTSIAELIEYVLLPYDKDIPEPKGINSFLDGLAELGINKRGIQNKVVLSQLIKKETEMEENSEEETDEESNEEISGEEEENEIEEKPIKKESCVQCGDGDVSVDNIVTCPRCCWRDAFFLPKPKLNEPVNCDMCNTSFPLNHDTLKSKLITCNNCESVTHYPNPNSNSDDEE